MSSNMSTHGTGHYFGPRCGEPTVQEWEEALAKRNYGPAVHMIDGKPWRDPGVGKTKLGEVCPARSSILDQIILENRNKSSKG